MIGSARVFDGQVLSLIARRQKNQSTDNGMSRGRHAEEPGQCSSLP